MGFSLQAVIFNRKNGKQQSVAEGTMTLKPGEGMVTPVRDFDLGESESGYGARVGFSPDAAAPNESVVFATHGVDTTLNGEEYNGPYGSFSTGTIEFRNPLNNYFVRLERGS